MANVSYNGMYGQSDMVTFTDIPNILKVEAYQDGTKAQFNFFWEGNLRQTVTADSQYYVTFMGETVTNVMDASKASNKRFFISGDEDGTAASFARALRNCSGIAAEFNVVNQGPDVYLVAKTIGKKWNTPNYFLTNISNDYLNGSGTDGQSYSVFFNGKIDVDVYSGSSLGGGLQNYVTTLEKNFYGNECAFDMSAVLATFSEFGATKPYTFRLSLMRADGEWQSIENVSGNTTVGYMANQSEKFLVATGVQPLINNSRGKNGSILYMYGNTIPYSVLCGLDTSQWSVVVSAKDSAFNEVWNGGTDTEYRTNTNLIQDRVFTVPQSVLDEAYYIDLLINGTNVRFNVIKPLKATEYYQRVQWRNEYGGISFFDFTGARSETDSVEIETYEKNIFDYYDTNYFERKMIYKNDVSKQVTLTTHLLKEDGKWIFNSLMKSKKVWTTVNGNVYYIIPKSIDVQEDQNYNNIYTAKFVYEYSDNN